MSLWNVRSTMLSSSRDEMRGAKGGRGNGGPAGPAVPFRFSRFAVRVSRADHSAEPPGDVRFGPLVLGVLEDLLRRPELDEVAVQEVRRAVARARRLLHV